ncbi:DUF1302 domain-containing protein [Colwellia hornerae]|uniref:DUF1302 domain-containing protein n=1 Tax=Colwellia hornerae TaxID=89402 RepID=A0A5C6QRR6_9GAMM|nr:DUF1302 domain-containing protein [Colwellia hornerae]TWX57683.1 DUF1302 domain-containing protein [Colwellia hornerae]TWX62586.1 DUF1302 domain-containing protein [Colwellia hornerae]TWX71497.1 DUF1302 domain-containing protein [Colwellia hornerae]
MKYSPRNRFYKKPLAASITAALVCLATVSQVQAENFTLGNFDVTFDSTFSYGQSWRVEDRNWNDNVGKANNFNNGFDFSSYHPSLNPTPDQATVWNGKGGYSTNGDNANLNYDSGDSFSQIIKGSHELEVRYENFGFFARGMYFYDLEMSDGDRAWTNPLSGVNNDPCRDGEASDQLCNDVRLLDAFVYGDFQVGDMPLSIRVGQQVISWGESTLISHGISELNPVDIARLRAPGSELKEAFIPFGAIWGSLGVSENFNIEAFYQYNWEKTVLPAPGSYFSTNDFAGDGGQFNNVQLGFAGNPDMDLDYLISGLNQLSAAIKAGAVPPESIGSAYLGAFPTKLTLRQADAENEPEDGGQYGLKLSWFLPDFNDTEVSLYHMNYHSRRPIFAGVTADFSNEAIGHDIGMLLSGAITEENYTNLKAFSRVELDYVEDIKVYAMSFNTVLGTTSVAGEVTFRQDEPLQIDDVELLFAAMPQQLANDQGRSELDGISQMPVFQGGQRADGFVLSDTLQAQTTLTHLWGPTFGASQLTTLVEVGGINIQDMPDQDVLRLNGPGTARNGGIAGKEGLEMAVQDGVETNPFPDAFAWGYRAIAKLDFNNVIAGINISPRVVFSHDVKGTTPDPLFLFVEKRKSVALGINFNYQSRWSADINYNGFWDGVGTTNQMEDRDYISFSIKYSI